MATFTVRVELHGNPSGEDYDTLHEAMQFQRFSRTIKDSDDVEFHLPTAEYNYIGALTKKQILERAQTAASKVGKKYSILVTESKGRAWSKLEKL